MRVEKLEALYIDMKNGIAEIKVNGVDISAGTFYLNFTFENGEWSLTTTKDDVYSTSDRDVKE